MATLCSLRPLPQWQPLQPSQLVKNLVTVFAQSRLNHRLHAGVERRRAAQVTLPLVRHPTGEVARTARAVHCLACCRQAEPLLGSLVGLHLVAFGHQTIPICLRTFILASSPLSENRASSENRWTERYPKRLPSNSSRVL